MFLRVFIASQSEITRRLDESSGIANDSTAAGSGSLSRSEIVHDEHPLSLGKSSVWNQFFQVPFQYVFFQFLNSKVFSFQ